MQKIVDTHYLQRVNLFCNPHITHFRGNVSPNFSRQYQTGNGWRKFQQWAVGNNGADNFHGNKRRYELIGGLQGGNRTYENRNDGDDTNRSHPNVVHLMNGAFKKDLETLGFEEHAAYKQNVDVLIRHMRKRVKEELVHELKDMGYTQQVINDEINAYMSTSRHKYLSEELSQSVKKQDIKPFVDLAKKAGLV